MRIYGKQGDHIQPREGWGDGIRTAAHDTGHIRVSLHDGRWYAESEHMLPGGERAVYRPYEVPFLVPTLYMYIHDPFPQVVASADPRDLGEFLGTRNGVARFLSPLQGSILTGSQFRSDFIQ